MLIFVTLKQLKEEYAFSKIAAQANEVRYFLNIPGN